MLLNKAKLESQLQNSLNKIDMKKDETNVRICNGVSMSSSTFTIDSILATKPVDIKLEYNSRSDSRSPSNSPSLSTTLSPIRPTRVPAILHPGLHLTHLAAAAATGFSTPSDFLGKCLFYNYFFHTPRMYVNRCEVHTVNNIVEINRKRWIEVN